MTRACANNFTVRRGVCTGTLTPFQFYFAKFSCIKCCSRFKVIIFRKYDDYAIVACLAQSMTIQQSILLSRILRVNKNEIFINLYLIFIK